MGKEATGARSLTLQLKAATVEQMRTMVPEFFEKCKKKGMKIVSHKVSRGTTGVICEFQIIVNGEHLDRLMNESAKQRSLPPVKSTVGIGQERVQVDPGKLPGQSGQGSQLPQPVLPSPSNMPSLGLGGWGTGKPKELKPLKLLPTLGGQMTESVERERGGKKKKSKNRAERLLDNSVGSQGRENAVDDDNAPLTRVQFNGGDRETSPHASGSRTERGARGSRKKLREAIDDSRNANYDGDYGDNNNDNDDAAGGDMVGNLRPSGSQTARNPEGHAGPPTELHRQNSSVLGTRALKPIVVIARTLGKLHPRLDRFDQGAPDAALAVEAAVVKAEQSLHHIRDLLGEGNGVREPCQSMLSPKVAFPMGDGPDGKSEWLHRVSTLVDSVTASAERAQYLTAAERLVTLPKPALQSMMNDVDRIETESRELAAINDSLVRLIRDMRKQHKQKKRQSGKGMMNDSVNDSSHGSALGTGTDAEPQAESTILEPSPPKLTPQPPSSTRREGGRGRGRVGVRPLPPTVGATSVDDGDAEEH